MSESEIEPYLKFVEGSISVHEIKSVKYHQTEEPLDLFLIDIEHKIRQ